MGWILIPIGVGVCALGGFFLNLFALKGQSPMFLIPIVTATRAVILFFMSLVVFGEFDGLPWWRLGLWLLGTLMSVAGGSLVAVFASAENVGDADSSSSSSEC